MNIAKGEKTVRHRILGRKALNNVGLGTVRVLSALGC